VGRTAGVDDQGWRSPENKAEQCQDCRTSQRISAPRSTSNSRRMLRWQRPSSAQ
jgi:hypothetical protein